MNEVDSSTYKTDSRAIYTHFQVEPARHVGAGEKEPEIKKHCAIHPEYPVFYTCSVCENLFCRFCPASIEGGLKICPFCGGQCILYDKAYSPATSPKETKYDDHKDEAKEIENEIKTVRSKLYLTDFLVAMKYPFKFPVSLLIGSVLFFILMFGQIVLVTSGGWTALGALVGFAVILMLKFGVFFKTVESFTRANFQNSFLPRVKKFAIWEDFFHPLIAGFGANIMAFGLLIVIAVSIGFYAWSTFAENSQTMEDEMRERGNQINSTLNANDPNKNSAKAREIRLKEMIDEAHLREFESVFGHNQLLESEQLEKLVQSVMNLTLTFQMPVLFAFLFGFSYFPAACLTLHKTRTFGGILEFKTGFKEIRELGFDYLKILLTGFGFITIFLAVVAGAFSIFEYLKLPVIGILSALIAGSFLFFYFWLVLSAIVGIAVSKRTASIQ
jgi:hypothetical protein